MRHFTLGPVYTGDEVEFDEVESTVSVLPRTHWRRSRKDVRHSGDRVDCIGDKVDRVGDNVDRDKLSNSSCCQFVAKTGDKVDRIVDSRLCRRFVASFGNSRVRPQCVPGFRY